MAPLPPSSRALTSDVLIVGAGIIGLSLALELRQHGATVIILESHQALAGASSAAAGMLAAQDPHNPPALGPLAGYSLDLYPGFLAKIQTLSGMTVPFQTDRTVQHTPSRTYHLPEHSIDPRQLAPALLSAARAASVHIVEHTAIASIESSSRGILIATGDGVRFQSRQLVHAAGAWTSSYLRHASPVITPRKGQMLRVTMPKHHALDEVHRAGHVYVVPRTCGPQAGTALIGATVEDAGFDISTHAEQLQQLRAWAARLAPETAFAAEAPLVEAWAGLRPSTPDGLPMLGPVDSAASLPTAWIATGHFRNGILLAPATARILASLLAGQSSPVDLAPFSPGRFF